MEGKEREHSTFADSLTSPAAGASVLVAREASFVSR